MESQLQAQPLQDEPTQDEPYFDEDAYYKTKKRKTIIWSAVFWVVMGAVGYFPEEYSDTYRLVRFFHGIIALFFLIRWFYLDAEQRDFRLNRIWAFMFLFLSPVAVLAYFVTTRHFGLFRSLFKAFAVLIIMGCCQAIGASIVYGFANFYPDTVAIKHDYLDKL